MKTVMDLETGRYLEEYLAFLGYSVREMPAIQSWCSQAGTLRPKMAAEVGLPEKVFVNVGCGDALATILGSGTFERSRIAFNSAGTSEIVGLSVEEKILSKEVMTIPGFITKSYDVHYGPTQSGSSSVLWFMQNVLGENDFEKVVREAEKVEAGAGGMFFVPYLSGERSPIWNPSATGSFQGIRAPYDRRYFIRSIMEGVCFSVRHVLEYCSRTAANKPTCLRISGGGSRTRLWCQMKADVCGLPVQRPVVTESAALGAAMGAAIAGGYYPDSSAATAHMVEMGEWLEPDRARHARYDEIYEQYRNVAEKYKAE